MKTYEQKLNADLDWALREGSMHFEEKNSVHDTLRRITQRLNELGIPYAVVGGMAMFAHGFRRFTQDVHLLVTRDSMNQIVAELEGLGYVKPFAASTTKLRDTGTGVQIDFLITGGFPGDGKPKPVAFPDPTNVSVEIGGARYVGLPTLIELKLASGTAAHRMKDLGDVQELIKTLGLPRDLSAQLNPFVRAKYEELWDAVANRPAGE
jgi:hypothetical protein